MSATVALIVAADKRELDQAELVAAHLALRLTGGKRKKRHGR